MAAHAATKARARGAVIKMIRAMIDEDITPQYGSDRVASRASVAFWPMVLYETVLYEGA
jgi:enoyl-CoA hydratase